MMLMKKYSIFCLLILCAFLAVGCDNGQDGNSSRVNQSMLNIDTSDMETLQCSRNGEADGLTTDLQYEVFYQGDYIQILHSIEKVMSEDQDILDQYEKAYRDIFANYEGLEYYDNEITRAKDSITSDTVINYGKIDMDKLLEIEGEEDNVIEDGKVKLNTWLEFAEQFGVTCE